MSFTFCLNSLISLNKDTVMNCIKVMLLFQKINATEIAQEILYFREELRELSPQTLPVSKFGCFRVITGGQLVTSDDILLDRRLPISRICSGCFRWMFVFDFFIFSCLIGGVIWNSSGTFQMKTAPSWPPVTRNFESGEYLQEVTMPAWPYPWATISPNS